MMKTNHLCGILLCLFFFTLISCRTDDFSNTNTTPENQFQNRKFSILNKKQVENIDGLLEKVQNAEKAIFSKENNANDFSKLNQDSLLQGRSINVNSVLLIEDHKSRTYTFKIDGASSSSVVENLVVKENADNTFLGCLCNTALMKTKDIFRRWDMLWI